MAIKPAPRGTPRFKKAKKRALTLGERGTYRGPKWGQIEKNLGFDPRRFAGPKKSPTMTLNFSRRPGGHGAKPPPKPSPMPVAVPTPPAVGPAAPSPAPVLPLTAGGQARVNAANAAVAAAEEQAKPGSYQAALRYGDLGEINRLAGMGYGAQLSEAPVLGELGGVERQRVGGIKSAGEARNRGNTFFSGKALQDVSDVNLSAEAARQDALNRYNTAVQEFNNAILEARTARDTTVGEANQEAYEWQEGLTPEDYGAPEPEAAAGGGGAPGAARVHPTKTKSHVAAGLRKTGTNTYVGPQGTVWHRTKSGKFARGKP